MYCVQCHNDVAFCVCPDIDERMRALRVEPHLLIAWCEVCDRAKSRCVCDLPKA